MPATAYRVDYDAVAPVYDSNPWRRKDPDPHLATFLGELQHKRQHDRQHAPTAVLDVGCGTGNQLVADLALLRSGSPATGIAPDGRARLVGLDPFAGMLRAARAKSRTISWVQGDGMRLPFSAASFDYATSQFSHHHVADVAALLHEVRRVLRSGGRFVLTNVAPRDMTDAQVYRWFPESLQGDLAVHPLPDALASLARAAGFTTANCQVERREWDTDLPSLASSFAQRLDDSRLNALPDDAYERRLASLRAAAAQRGAEPIRDAVAVLTLIANVA